MTIRDHARLRLLEATGGREQHVTWGASGASLLASLLARLPGTQVIMPAFICPSVAGAAVAVGKHVILLDIDPDTLHVPKPAIEDALSSRADSETILLIDHCFGYPVPYLAELKACHPALTLIEDCVRAAGAHAGSNPVGMVGDWVLISLYKCVLGSAHGAALLGPDELPPAERPAVRIGPRELLAGSSILRSLRSSFKAQGPPSVVSPRLIRRPLPRPRPDTQGPSNTAITRYLRHLERQGADRNRLADLIDELRRLLEAQGGLRCVSVAPTCLSSGDFLSVLVEEGPTRGEVLTALWAEKVFATTTWDLIPTRFVPLEVEVPYGDGGATITSDRVLHLPVGPGTSDAILTRVSAALRRLD